jgi:hypothetical protein
MRKCVCVCVCVCVCTWHGTPCLPHDIFSSKSTGNLNSLWRCRNVYIHHGSFSHLRELVQRENKKEKKGHREWFKSFKKWFSSPFFFALFGFFPLLGEKGCRCWVHNKCRVGRSRRGKTRDGTRRGGMGRWERKKRGSGIKDRVGRSCFFWKKFSFSPPPLFFPVLLKTSTKPHDGHARKIRSPFFSFLSGSSLMCVHFYKFHQLHLPSLFEKSKKSTILFHPRGGIHPGGVESTKMVDFLGGGGKSSEEVS